MSLYIKGNWNSNTDDDFEYRNGTLINIMSLQPTENLDVLADSLLEKPLYNFGQSCTYSVF